MKKYLCLALTLVLTAALFTGCGCTNRNKPDMTMPTVLPTTMPTVPQTEPATRPTTEPTRPSTEETADSGTDTTDHSASAPTESLPENRSRMMPGNSHSVR